MLDAKAGGYTVGVLVQCNYGSREQLRIAGVNVGREISEHTVWRSDTGSIIVVVATDAPRFPASSSASQKRFHWDWAVMEAIRVTDRETFSLRFRRQIPGLLAQRVSIN